MNRRTFLGALAAVLAAPSILAKLRATPRIIWRPVHGGGITFLRSRKAPPSELVVVRDQHGRSWHGSRPIHGVDYFNVYRDERGTDWLAAPKASSPPSGWRKVGERTPAQLAEARRS